MKYSRNTLNHNQRKFSTAKTFRLKVIILYKQNYYPFSTWGNYVLYFLYIQLAMQIQMRDSDGSASEYNQIDVFNFVVNSSIRTSDPVLLFGEAGLATVFLSYRIRCVNRSVCGDESHATCSGSGQGELIREQVGENCFSHVYNVIFGFVPLSRNCHGKRLARKEICA